MRVKTEGGKTKDVEITDVTPQNYIVEDKEKHLYHAIIEVRKFSSEDGKRLSVPRIQKFGQKTFETSVLSNLKKQGYTITILHDPNEWLKEQAEANQKAKELQAEKIKEDAEKAKQEAAEQQQKSINDAVDKALKEQAEANQKAINQAVADALAKQSKATPEPKPTGGK